jgi:hypothetical protein
MMLLTAANRKALPALHSTDAKDPRTVRVPVKFFTPDANWTWYAWEASVEGGETIFFGLVSGLEKELGYFALSELSAAKGLLGLPIERDRYWDSSKTVFDVLKAEGMDGLAEALVAGR